MTPQAKTLAEIKDEYARERNYDSWVEFRDSNWQLHGENVQSAMDEIAERYAIQFRNEWIRVEDNLPVENQPVLICSKQLSRVTPSTFSDGRFNRYDNYVPNERAFHYYYDKVTHWMSMPYKPEK